MSTYTLHLGPFTCRKSTWDRQLYFPSEGRRAEDFNLPLKIRLLRPGLNPRTWVPKARWWAQKWPKHVEHIISAINHSVASSWFFFSTYRSVRHFMSPLLVREFISETEWLTTFQPPVTRQVFKITQAQLYEHHPRPSVICLPSNKPTES